MNNMTTRPDTRPPPKYPRTPLWPHSPSADRDDRFINDTSPFLGQPITITEKLDGTNLLLHQGRTMPRATSQDAARNHPWTAMARKHHAWKLTGPEQQHILLYAEDIYPVHSIGYDPVPEDQTLRVFASISVHPDEFDDFAETVLLAQKLDIPTVPILFQGTLDNLQQIQEILDTVHASPSRLGPTCEGAVIRTTAAFRRPDFHLNVCKSVRRDHVTTSEHWTKNWRPCAILPPHQTHQPRT